MHDGVWGFASGIGLTTGTAAALAERAVATAKVSKPLTPHRVELADEPPGCRITMTEEPVSGLGQWLHNPATEALLLRRNAEALTRLTALVERHTHPSK